ncbi:MAG: tetratricopeptide repeat protein [Dehalococcoidia bacterium]|nr:tetratricopeptide repeat protein [Dehalococcoidia bacterium]
MQMQTIVQQSPGSDYALRAVEALEEVGATASLGEVGYVYYRHRQYENARETFALALEEDDLADAELAYRTYYLAASYEDDGYPEEAIPLYDEATTFDPDSPYTHRAKYWAARATESTGDALGASARYADLASNGPGGEFSTEAAFRAGYVLLKDGDPAGAVAAWNRLDADEGRAGALLGGPGARTELEEIAEARAAYDAARNRDPLGFYGLEAARELGPETAIDGGDYEALPTVEDPDWDVVATWLNGGGKWRRPLLRRAPRATCSWWGCGVRRSRRSVRWTLTSWRRCVQPGSWGFVTKRHG